MAKKSCHKCTHLIKVGVFRGIQQWKCLRYKGNECLSGFPFNRISCHGFEKED